MEIDTNSVILHEFLRNSHSVWHSGMDELLLRHFFGLGFLYMVGVVKEDWRTFSFSFPSYTFPSGYTVHFTHPSLFSHELTPLNPVLGSSWVPTLSGGYCHGPVSGVT